MQGFFSAQKPPSKEEADVATDGQPSPGDGNSQPKSFNGIWAKNVEESQRRKSLIICGISRGGTSFAASVFGRLGVPFARQGERQVGARYEHRELRHAFGAKDRAAIRRIATDFSKQYDVWAWKLPSIQRDIELVADCVPNPHFVIIFKEPLSIAVRKMDIKGKETVQALQQVMTVYQHMADICVRTKHPLLLISYDKALSAMHRFLPDAAAFVGIRDFNVEEVIANVRKDGQDYFRPKKGRPAKGEPRQKADLSFI